MSSMHLMVGPGARGSKGDYDGAMTQYLKTIGRLEPSYVIRKVRTYRHVHTHMHTRQARFVCAPCSRVLQCARDGA
jgi:hypothetical protein